MNEARFWLRISWLWITFSGLLDLVARVLLGVSSLCIKLVGTVVVLQRQVDKSTESALSIAAVIVEEVTR